MYHSKLTIFSNTLQMTNYFTFTQEFVNEKHNHCVRSPSLKAPRLQKSSVEDFEVLDDSHLFIYTHK
jgi:hypothetical protein